MIHIKITKLHAREILDSRGNPTLEVEAYSNNIVAIEQVPSGASKGIYEALELRDKGRRYFGLGVQKAVNNVNNIISKKLVGMDARKQDFIDKTLIKLDGTKNKSRLGANAILGVSLAVARLSSQLKKKPLYKILGKKAKLPTPFFNVINGGKHADNNLSFQEFMIVPEAESFKEKLRIGTEIYHKLKEEIHKKYKNSNVGDEGGFAPNIKKVEQALDLLLKTIKKLNYEKKVKIAIDVAASELYNKKKKKYKVDNKFLTSEQLLQFYGKLIENYPIISIEDPFEQDDFEAWKKMTALFGKKIQIVGDDLLVTNPSRIKYAIRRKLCNALLLKVNQIGTLTESIEAAKLAFKAKWKVMVSHRSGETTSSFIADLAVALGTGQIKSGAPCRSERLAKYNRLLVIEEELQKNS